MSEQQKQVEHEHLESKKLFDSETSLEICRSAGIWYEQFIDALTKSHCDPELPNNLESTQANFLRTLATSVRSYLANQQEDFERYALTPKIMLEKVFDSPLLAQFINNESGYELKTLSPGLFAIYVARVEDWIAIRASAQAIAVRKRDQSVPFLLLRNFHAGGIREKYHNENLPHEVHHIVWKTVQADLLVAADAASLSKIAFLHAQDELLARLCSNGNLAVYPVMDLFSAEMKELVEQEARTDADKVMTFTLQINETLEKIQFAIKERPTAAFSDLFLATCSASSFNELIDNLNIMLTKIQSEKAMQTVARSTPAAPTNIESVSGWDQI
jgi:hypothetical protein